MTSAELYDEGFAYCATDIVRDAYQCRFRDEDYTINRRFAMLKTMPHPRFGMVAKIEDVRAAAAKDGQ